MAEYEAPQNKAQFDQNFAQIKPLMNDTQAYYESARCLFCYDAPCIQACPTGIDIPLFIRQINTGNTIGAAKTIYDANYLGNTCGKVCPTEVLCEGACVYNHQDVKPIEIGRLQSYATSHAIISRRKLYEQGKPNGKKVAVVGAGPAGISCACELRKFGYAVDIFEAKDKPSGLTIYGVAPYKITNEEALLEMDYLGWLFGYHIHFNHPIRSEEEWQELEQIYEAIFLGIGLGETPGIGIPGESLDHCHGAVEFIENLRVNQHKVQVGKKVVVLGGGNTAMDAASESARMGAETVLLAYRRPKDTMGAYGFEYDLAKSVGVQGMFNVAPLEIIGNGKVEGVRFIRTEIRNGKLKNIAGSEFVEPCDMVIRATGQSKQIELLKKIKGLTLDKAGRIVVRPGYQTTNPHYFAGGDAVNGGVEVVNAVAEAKAAALGIHQYITGPLSDK